jgi:hypothetical protein
MGNLVPRYPPGYRGKNTVIGVNRYFRDPVKRILLARQKGAEGPRLNNLLQVTYARLMFDLKNKKQAVDWLGVMRLLQLFGTVLDKERYSALSSAQGLHENSVANLRPRFTAPPLLVGLGKERPKSDES